MIPYFYAEILVKRRWFKEEEFIDIITVSQSVPGAIAVNASFNIGMCKRGIWGGIFAVLGMTIPAFTAIVLILLFFLNIKDELLVRKAITGILTASTALITMSFFRLSNKVFSKKRLDNILLSVFVFIAITAFNVDIVWLLLLGVIIGLLRHFKKNMNNQGDVHIKD